MLLPCLLIPHSCRNQFLPRNFLSTSSEVTLETKSDDFVPQEGLPDYFSYKFIKFFNCIYIFGNKKVGQMILMTPSNCISVLVQKIRKNLETSNFAKNFTETGKGDGGAIYTVWGIPGSSGGKESTCNAGDPGSIPKICQRRERLPAPVFLAFPGGSASEEFNCNAGDWIQPVGWEDLLEKGKATHSSILA